MLGAVEEVRVHAQRDVRARVPELPRHEDDVRALRDQQARERVPQVVEAQPRAVLAVELRSLQRPLEGSPAV